MAHRILHMLQAHSWHAQPLLCQIMSEGGMRLYLRAAGLSTEFPEKVHFPKPKSLFQSSAQNLNFFGCAHSMGFFSGILLLMYSTRAQITLISILRRVHSPWASPAQAAASPGPCGPSSLPYVHSQYYLGAHIHFSHFLCLSANLCRFCICSA